MMSQDWFEKRSLDSGWGACYMAIEDAEIHEAVEAVKDVMRYWLKDCESPIEVVMGAALFRAAELRDSLDGSTWRVLPQWQVLSGKYRVDFLVKPWWEPEEGPPVQPIAVECDGHDFHERTKEQAARDKRRDRAFVASGIRVMRFTGSEVLSDPMACAQQVIDVFEREWSQWYERQAPPANEAK